MPVPIRIKRIYEAPDDRDGTRYLVDRLWPRGVSKDRARLDGWLKLLAPSDTMRRAFHAAGDASDAGWQAFRTAYFAELDAGGGEIDAALGAIDTAQASGPVTLLYAAHNQTRNNAAALAEWLARRDRA